LTAKINLLKPDPIRLRHGRLAQAIDPSLEPLVGRATPHGPPVVVSQLVGHLRRHGGSTGRLLQELAETLETRH